MILIDGDMLPTRVDNNGYPRTKCGRYFHRVVMELILGRSLTSKEVVHHIDYDKLNNTPSNLMLCRDHKHHVEVHAIQRITDIGLDPKKYKWCSGCKEVHLKEEFPRSKNRWDGLSNNCKYFTNKYRKDRGLNKDKFDWKARMNQQFRRAVKHKPDSLSVL